MLTIDQYTAHLQQLNEKSCGVINKITLLPGMDFLDQQKWWTKGGRRSRPHEGVDLVFWSDEHGKRHFLRAGLKVACLISGEIVAICDDFLGKSVFVRGNDRSYRDIVAIHAHILPIGRVGDRLSTGEEIGIIAPATGVVPAHLHLSMLRDSPALSKEEMNWQYLNRCEMNRFLNPFIKGNLEELEFSPEIKKQ